MFERIKQRAKLIRPLLVPLILYIGLLSFSISWLRGNPESLWRYVIALLPMAPGVWIALGLLRAILQLDEMERLVLLQGMAFSFAITLILVLSLGLLELAGMPPVNGVYIGFAMALLWLVGKLWMNRRYE